MEMELSSLIEKIKKDGVTKAEEEAQSIIAEARENAKKIIGDAESTKACLIQEGKESSENFQKVSEKALKQSARDVLLGLKERSLEFFERIVNEKIGKELSPDVLKEILIKLIGNFSKDKDMDIEILVSEEDKTMLQKTLFNAMSKEAKQHVSITSSKGVGKGFRIGEKGKESYYDFTDESITKAFVGFLNPKLSEMLDIDLGLNNKKKNAG